MSLIYVPIVVSSEFPGRGLEECRVYVILYCNRPPSSESINPLEHSKALSLLKCYAANSHSRMCLPALKFLP